MLKRIGAIVVSAASASGLDGAASHLASDPANGTYAEDGSATPASTMMSSDMDPSYSSVWSAAAGNLFDSYACSAPLLHTH